MDWSELIPSLIRTPITIYQNRKTIQHWWIRLLAQVDTGDTDIVLLGQGGVGKTLLSKCLHGQAPKFSYKTPGTSPNVETEAVIFGDWTKLVRVIPGQSSKERLKGLDEAFNTSESLEGVIYVVDWGYAKIRDETLKKALIEDRGIDTIAKLREYTLRNELEDLDLMMMKIRDLQAKDGRPKWLIIAVNKVDLYMNEVDEAQKYYSIDYGSDFAKVVNEYLHQIGTLNLKVFTLPISSWPEDFEWNNEMIDAKLGGKSVEHGLALNFISEISVISKG
ncbi:GTPase domain-containing protein [Rufibacter hautae]|uniref:GTPase domain-containing protein n=1 Tax=Rufibacter hautae TaxID=2595005 RepID=A0A5B6TG02_9BACT|nr:GTPase domain-containing protein [Rufibacter hautae]KAA3439572.1 GTPase domain-containing protein [Rufibacter hautae]